MTCSLWGTPWLLLLHCSTCHYPCRLWGMMPTRTTSCQYPGSLATKVLLPHRPWWCRGCWRSDGQFHCRCYLPFRTFLGVLTVACIRRIKIVILPLWESIRKAEVFNPPWWAVLSSWWLLRFIGDYYSSFFGDCRGFHLDNIERLLAPHLFYSLRCCFSRLLHVDKVETSLLEKSWQGVRLPQ